MFDGIEGFSIVSHQDEEFLVRAPLGVEFRVEVTKVLGHQSILDKALLYAIEDFVNGGSNKDD